MKTGITILLAIMLPIAIIGAFIALSSDTINQHPITTVLMSVIITVCSVLIIFSIFSKIKDDMDEVLDKPESV